MYYGQKKSAMTWVSQIFLGISVLILGGVIVWGVMVTRDGGQRSSGKSAKEPASSFQLRK